MVDKYDKESIFTKSLFKTGDQHYFRSFISSTKSKVYIKIIEEIKELKEENKELKKDIKITCPHCNKIGNTKHLMERWHFDNCKNKK